MEVQASFGDPPGLSIISALIFFFFETKKLINKIIISGIPIHSCLIII